MSRWTNTRSLRSCKPVARVEGSTPDVIAALVRRRIHTNSLHDRYIVAVAEGHVYATPHDGLAAQGIPTSAVVGTYTRTIQVRDLTDDLRFFLDQHTREAA